MNYAVPVTSFSTFEHVLEVEERYIHQFLCELIMVQSYTLDIPATKSTIMELIQKIEAENSYQEGRPEPRIKLNFGTNSLLCLDETERDEHRHNVRLSFALEVLNAAHDGAAEVVPPDMNCTVCGKNFCMCGGSRCSDGEAILPNCSCGKICNDCMFNYSRNSGVSCCDDDNCQNKIFICAQCDAPQNYHIDSDEDITHSKLWGKIATEGGQTYISYDY